MDPRVRHTFWTQTLGLAAVYVGLFSSNQMMVQRYMSVASVRRAQAYVTSNVVDQSVLQLHIAIVIALSLYLSAARHYESGCIQGGPKMIPRDG